ncbi:MAG: hypothetical protein PHV37_06035 [Candidatus Gastranaerophilales bacterium]|nr:hypothetical protein [Candidatus Gastranaerophilales bacterium]
MKTAPVATNVNNQKLPTRKEYAKKGFCLAGATSLAFSLASTIKNRNLIKDSFKSVVDDAVNAGQSSKKAKAVFALGTAIGLVGTAFIDGTIGATIGGIIGAVKNKNANK